MSRPTRARLLPLVLAVLAALAVPSAVGAAVAGVVHDWPVQPATVTRPFTVGLHEWLPGHRGIDLAATPSTTVHATAPGEVTFAGRVPTGTWVTILHVDGVRTSLGPLQDLRVAPGDLVRGGEVLGRAAPADAHDGVHWSARRGGTYLDPLLLVRIEVVPTLVGPGGWEPSGLHPLPGYEPWDGRDRRVGLLPSTQPATAPGWRSAPNGNDVVGVAGLLTSTGSTPLPLDFLGYPPQAVTHLSHAGRAVGSGGGAPDDPWRDQLPYDAADTLRGVDRSARLLAQQLRAQWRARPGVAVDLVGHSFGGVVVLHYLLAHHDPADPTLPPIGHVVTLASPLQGAPGASAVDRWSWGVLDAAVDVAGWVLGVGPDPPSLDDLAVGSPLLRDLAEAWARAQADPHRSPLATGTRVLTIGGSRDVVVPEHRSDLPGADHVTVPGGHTAMHETEATLQVVRAFLADRDVPASAGGWGAWLSPGVSLGEQLVGVVL